MTKTKTYCDVCGKEKEANDMASFEVRDTGKIRIFRETGSYYTPLRIDICRECLERHGFEINANEQPAKNTQTFQDRFLDLLEECGVAFEG